MACEHPQLINARASDAATSQSQCENLSDVSTLGFWSTARTRVSALKLSKPLHILRLLTLQAQCLVSPSRIPIQQRLPCKSLMTLPLPHSMADVHLKHCCSHSSCHSFHSKEGLSHDALHPTPECIGTGLHRLPENGVDHMLIQTCLCSAARVAHTGHAPSSPSLADSRVFSSL